MKHISKFQGCVACLFFILLFVALGSSPVMAAEKDCNDAKWANHPACAEPDDPPPDPDDPCLTSESDFPAFMFWHKLNTANDSNWGIFLASEDGVCVRQLFEVPDSSSAWMWDSSFSYDSSENENRGYATWIRRGTYENQEEDSIWLLEFGVEGNTITTQSEPELIVMLPDNDPTKVEAYLPDLDVSKDLQNLAFTYLKILPEGVYNEVHVFDIETCRFLNPACMPTIDSLVSYSDYNLGKVSWGPFGERFYLTEESGDVRQIKMITEIDGEWVSQLLLSSNDYPEYDGIWRMSSGIIGDREKLAFRHGGDCRTISVIDVFNCATGPTEDSLSPCDAEYQFYGTNPGWTDQGTVVHEIVERVKKHPRKEIYECRTSDFIGEWDPDTPDITPLVEGEDPDTR